MQINTKTRYGLRTMIEIALQKGNRGILQKEIARNQGISEKYLDHIIASLKTAGLITNVAGKRSGYMLAKPASEISIHDLYLVFNREVALVDCLEKGKVCNREDRCAANDYWDELNSYIVQKMSSTTLRDLTEKQEYLNQQYEPMLYYI